MNKKKKSGFKAVLGFEYTSIIKNKAFIISTVFIVAILLLASLLPVIIAGIVSGTSDDEETEKPKIAIINNAYNTSDILAKSFEKNFSNYDITMLDKEDELKNGVKDGTYSFAVILNKPLEYQYVTNTNSITDTTTETIDKVVTSTYHTSELQKKGITAEESEKILTASAKSSIITLGTDQTSAYLSTYILIMGLYMAILLYGQLVSNSVVTEKSTRAMEMLITCASPSDLMFGKVIGAGLAGFTQIAVIFGVGILSFSTMSASIPAELSSIISFPIESALFALLSFVLAFFIYAFMLAAIASLVSRAEDLNNMMTPVMLIIIFAFMVVVIGVNSGDLTSPLMILTSYIPFTAPLSMFARVAMSNVAAWEIIISIVIQIVSIFILGKLAAAVYRIGVLMYGKPPRFSEVFKMLRANKAK